MPQRSEQSLPKRKFWNIPKQAPEKKIKLDPEAERTLPNFVQPTLPGLQQHRSPFADDSDVAKRIDKAIMDFIVVDMLPYSVVEEGSRHMNFADPAGPRRYKPKCEKY